MRRLEFTNVTWVPIESNQPEGKILSQSVPAKTEVDVNTPITIEYAVKPQQQAKMPSLVGMQLQAAKNMMDLLGFANVRWVEVEHSAPAGTVVSQSVEKNSMIGMLQEIVVEYSNGLYVEPVTKPVTIAGLPFGETEQNVTIMKVTQAGQFELVMEVTLAVGQTSITVELTDISVQKYEIWLDGRRVQTITVDFGTDPVEPEPPVEPEVPAEPTEPEQPETDQVEDGE